MKKQVINITLKQKPAVSLPVSSNPEPDRSIFELNTLVELKLSRENIINYEIFGNWEEKPDVPPNEETIKNHPSDDPEFRRNLIINGGVQRKITKLMASFGNIWPSYSPYECWFCCSPFIEPPVGIPERLNIINEEYRFELYGNFCSYNCASRYLNPQNEDDFSCIQCNLDLCKGDERAEKNQLLELMANIETDMDIYQKIKLAPPRLSLKRFGGHLTIEEFRENFNKHSTLHIFKTPLIPITYLVEECQNPAVK